MNNYTDAVSTASNSVQAGVAYYYRVQANNSAGVTSYSYANSGTSVNLTLPTVSVTTLLDNANFAGTDGNPQDGYLDFHRTGDVTSALTANVSYAGSTAVAGTDYSGTLPTSVTFPAGQQDVIVPVVPDGGGPDLTSDLLASIVDPPDYTAAIGLARVNLNDGTVKAKLGTNSGNVILQGSSDGKSNTVPLVLTFPADQPANSTITISSAQSGILDVWTTQYPGAAAEPIPWNLGSITWTFGGGSPPPTQLWIGATGPSSKINNISFQLSDWQPNSITAFGPAVANSNPGTAVCLFIHDASDANITNTTQNYEVGQIADLHMEVASPFPAAQISHYSWVPQGNVLYDWQEPLVPLGSGPMDTHPVGLEPSNGATGASMREATFFWVSVGGGAAAHAVSANDEVDATVVVNGQQIGESVMFHVSEPVVVTDVQSGKAGVGVTGNIDDTEPTEPFVGLGRSSFFPAFLSAATPFPRPQFRGTVWSAVVDAGSIGGDWKFLQTVTPNLTFSGPNTHISVPNASQVGLDTSDPYDGTYSAGPVEQMSGDTPGAPLSWMLAHHCNYGDLDLNFTTYIMYRPPGSAEWVPLGSCNWWFDTGVYIGGVTFSNFGAQPYQGTPQPHQLLTIQSPLPGRFVRQTAEPTWTWRWLASDMFSIS